ncbi:hypothetical protein [Streptomyces sp. NPDC127084]|uniref:hypothetical protein n=1 Tax=Streptomyces sp. NPDC127084 TaxID=3347133 RepID=UPI00365DA1CA
MTWLRAETPALGAAAEPAVTALSQAEPEKLGLTQADLPDHKIGEPNAADRTAGKAATADKPECAVFVDTMAMRPVGAPGATAIRKLVAVPKTPPADASPEEKAKAALGALGGTFTYDTLSSYEGKGAADALDAYKKAGADCASGFVLTTGADKIEVTKVETAQYSAGDESVAFKFSVDLDGTTGTSHLVVVRKGANLGSFPAQSFAGTAEQPKTVIDAQVKKLA